MTRADMTRSTVRAVESLAQSEGLWLDTSHPPRTSVVLCNDKRGEDEEVLLFDAGTVHGSLEVARLYLMARRRERLALHQPAPRLP